MNTSIYDELTNKVIQSLENGVAPWIKPWNTTTTADKNMVSGKPYRGVNTLILGMSGMAQGFSTNLWASYKQWQELGATVRKGEKGTRIVFYSPVSKEKVNSTGETVTENYACLKTYYVFNASQCDDIEIPKPETVEKSFLDIEACEQFITDTGALIRHGGAEAFYHRSDDFIGLPVKTDFLSNEHYYATAFHELTHWTGAKHRLEREKGKLFGDTKYAFEELVAELGATFLCNDFSFTGELRHEAYIQSWLKALKDDNKAIFKASALAQKACDYLKQCKAQPVAIAA